MKKLILFTIALVLTTTLSAQTSKTELYDFIKKMITDSTGYSNVGD